MLGVCAARPHLRSIKLVDCTSNQESVHGIDSGDFVYAWESQERSISKIRAYVTRVLIIVAVHEGIVSCCKAFQ